MSITLRYAGWEDRAQAMSLVDQLWRRGHRLSWDVPLFDWMFGARRHLWDHDGYSFAIASNQDEPVGIHAGVPFRLNVRGESKLGLWRMLWIVVPDARAGNAGLLLHRAVDRPPYINVSFGINDLVARLYKAMGYALIPDIPRHVAVLPGGAAASDALLGIAYPTWEAARRTALVAALQVRVPDRQGGEVAFGLPEDWERQGWAKLAPQVIGAARDQDYLTWRYVDHPGFTYRLLSVRQGADLALAVWRAETIRAPGQDGALCQMGRVVEILLPEPRLGPDLLAALYADMTAQGMALADYYGYHHATAQLLDGCGFRAAHDVVDGPLIPTRFQPLDGGTGTIKSGLHAPKGLEVPSFPVGPGGDWLWSKGDSDQDRPN